MRALRWIQDYKPNTFIYCTDIEECKDAGQRQSQLISFKLLTILSFDSAVPVCMYFHVVALNLFK